jgi:hypothetical protein
MAILEIRPRDPSQARHAPVEIVLCDVEGAQVDGFITATGEAIVKSWTGRTDSAGVLDVDLTPNADITPSQTGYRVTVAGVSLVIVKSAATETVYGALAVGLAPLGPIAAAGLAAGGTTGQVLTKQSATNYDADWETPTALSSLPSGTTPSATDTVVGVQGGAAVRFTCAQLVGNIVSSTATDGRVVAGVSSLLRGAVSTFLDSGDAQPAGYMSASAGLRMGPGGSTPPDTGFQRTGAAQMTQYGQIITTSGYAGNFVSCSTFANAAHGLINHTVNPAQTRYYTNSGDANPTVGISATGGITLGAGGASAVDWTLARTATATATMTGGLISTGANNGLQTVSGTATHGSWTVATTTFGTFASIRLNSADAQPGMLLSATGMQLGAGGATAPSWLLSYTSTALATITGSVAFTAGSSIRATTTGAGLQIGSASNQLIGKWGSTPVARPGGWTAATGTATRTSFDTATVTLQQLAERVKALIDDNFTRGDHGA